MHHLVFPNFSDFVDLSELLANRESPHLILVKQPALMRQLYSIGQGLVEKEHSLFETH